MQYRHYLQFATNILNHVDTRFYWNLTEHIYRYNHANNGNSPGLTGPPGIHTVNERKIMPSITPRYTDKSFRYCGGHVSRADPLLHHSDPEC